MFRPRVGHLQVHNSFKQTLTRKCTSGCVIYKELLEMLKLLSVVQTGTLHVSGRLQQWFTVL